VLAPWVVADIAVISGQGLRRFINIKMLRMVTAVVLIGLA
jgi:hypothetical protein